MSPPPVGPDGVGPDGVGLDGVTLEPVAPDDAAALADLWTRCLPDHPLDAPTLRQHLDPRYARADLQLQLRRGDRTLGFALGRGPFGPGSAASWASDDLAYLSALAVAPDARGHGLGSALYRTLLGRLQAGGARRLVVGTDPGSLIPGVPQGVGREGWRFLRARGARFGRLEFDLHLDLEAPPPPHPLGAGLSVRDDDPVGVLTFLDRVFPGRWRDEVEGYLEAGCTALALVQDARVIGFCALFSPDDALIGPSLTWRGALVGPAAGLGPIGIDPSVRGRGYGLALVTAGARRLRERGARELIVNWTTLAGFYGRVGARIWRTYQRTELPLPGGTP